MSLCLWFSNVVTVHFIRSALFGFNVVVEAESGRALAGHPCTSIAPELIVTNPICLSADCATANCMIMTNVHHELHEEHVRLDRKSQQVQLELHDEQDHID